MKVGLVDVDGHGKKKKWGATIYPNLALAKIAGYHRAKGDIVEWAVPMLVHYDILYMSKVFNFSPDDDRYYDADKIVKGGTGYNISAVLPQEIDDHQPDFSLYAHVPTDTSYGFLSRGCPNRCKWCVVPIKEGAIKPYWDIERVANGKKKVVLMDNNILAAGEYCMEQLRKIIALGLRVDFNQALDARLVNEENAKLLAQIKWIDNRIRFGCDTHPQIAECERAMALINGYGYKGQYFLYTMLQGSFEECYDRIHYWWVRNHEIRAQHKGNAIYPYAQPYRNPIGKKYPPPNGRKTSPDGATQRLSLKRWTSSNTPMWQKDMAHWCNKKQIFDIVDFMDFEPRKGFKCSAYLLEE